MHILLYTRTHIYKRQIYNIYKIFVRTSTYFFVHAHCLLESTSKICGFYSGCLINELTLETQALFNIYSSRNTCYLQTVQVVYLPYCSNVNWTVNESICALIFSAKYLKEIVHRQNHKQANQ